MEYRERDLATVVDTIVLHATVEPTLQGSIDVLRERGCSYHYLIDRDGTTVECAAPSKAAFHAGESLGPQGEGVNEYSIGISFVNLNDGIDPYTERQLQSARQLIADLRPMFLELRYLTTHAVISPHVKNDPVGFPLDELASAAGLQVWL